MLFSVSVQWQSVVSFISLGESGLCCQPALQSSQRTFHFPLDFSVYVAVVAVFSKSETVESFGRRWVWCWRVFMKSLCISDWSGSWSDLVHCHDRSLSSVLLNLVHPGETFCSTSSTGKTEKPKTHSVIIIIFFCALLSLLYCFWQVEPSYLEAVFKLLADKIEGNGVDARVKWGHVDADVIHH